MNASNSGIIERVSDRIVAAIIGSGDIQQAVASTVTELFTTSMKTTQQPGTSVTAAITGLASGAIRSASQLGASLGEASKGLMLGVLLGTKQTRDHAINAIMHTAEVAIQNTAAVEGDLESVTTGLLKGAKQGAQEIGLRAEDAVSAAADGALKAARKIGLTAIATVRAGIDQATTRSEPKLALLGNMG